MFTTTTTTTTTRDRGDRYGPIEWAQQRASERDGASRRPAYTCVPRGVDAPVITCSSSSAFVGERNAFLRCDIKARPWVTALYWILDLNGTTIGKADSVSDYWTKVMVSTGRSQCRVAGALSRTPHCREAAAVASRRAMRSIIGKCDATSTNRKYITFYNAAGGGSSYGHGHELSILRIIDRSFRSLSRESTPCVSPTISYQSLHLGL